MTGAAACVVNGRTDGGATGWTAEGLARRSGPETNAV
ncbi:Uncharacterised protein [Mycobacterium tuberculosis]|nr:Uncharacterised protein [Mycobacterium tuberculosis]